MPKIQNRYEWQAARAYFSQNYLASLPEIEKGEIWQREKQQHFFAKNADMKQANG